MNANQDQQKPTTAIKPVTQVEKLNNTPIEEPKKEKGLEHDVDGSQGFSEAAGRPGTGKRSSVERDSSQEKELGAQDAELGSEESDEDLH
jgi:hypothetical protein